MNRKAGFALVFAIIIMSLIMAVMASFFAITTSDLALANTTANTIRAYYLAEAGLARKFVELRGGNASSLSTQTMTLATGNTGTYEVGVEALSGSSLPAYTLRSTGTYNNISKTISLTVQQASYSRYVYIGSDRGGWYYFNTSSVVRGSLYDNQQLGISGDPVFYGPVSTTASSISYYHGGPPLDNPDFRDSLTLGAPGISVLTSTWPSQVMSPLMTAAWQAGGLYLSGGRTIRLTLLSNGTMNVTKVEEGINYNVPLPQNKALYVDAKWLYISGILSGQLTIGTGAYIFVSNNILYADDPRTNPASTDMLALLTTNILYLPIDVPNLEIDAYIVAKSFRSVGGGQADSITLYGGITWMTTNWSVRDFQPISGQIYYTHDTRMENTPPAYLPPLKDAGRIVYIKTQWAEL
jgi:hypothetical protein